MTTTFETSTITLEDKNEVLSTRIWELVKAGSKSYNLFDYEGIRIDHAPADRGPASVDVKVETLYRKTQKDDWVSFEDFIKQPGVTPFGKVRYTLRYNVTISVTANDKYFDSFELGTVRYWFTKKCSDMTDAVLGGILMDYDRMATHISVEVPDFAFDGDECNVDYLTNLNGAWLLLVDRHIKAQNQKKSDELSAMFA